MAITEAHAGRRYPPPDGVLALTNVTLESLTGLDAAAVASR